MALLPGKNVNLWIKHATYTNDEEWLAVCATNLGIDESSNENTIITKCDTFTTPGAPDNSITLDLVFVKGEPALNEITAKIIKKIARSQSEFNWRIADANPSAQDIDDSGVGIITSMSQEYPAEGYSTMSITIKINGNITDAI